MSASLSIIIIFLTAVSILTTPSTSSTETFVFGGCTQLKYTPGSPYESNINSLLTSLVNSAMFTSYNNFTILGSSSSSQDTVYGLFQCRGDLDTTTCGRCVARSVSQLGTLCFNACGGALQLEGCFVKYDNSTFLGAEDKTEVVKKCGPSIDGYESNSDALTRRDAVLAYLAAGDGSYQPYRVSGSGNMQGVAQCVGDLSQRECVDCLTEATGRLKTECGPAAWGDVYLAKCYARYSEGGMHSGGGSHSHTENDTNNNDNEIEKTLAIVIGLIVAVGLGIVFLSFMSRLCDKRRGGK